MGLVFQEAKKKIYCFEELPGGEFFVVEDENANFLYYKPVGTSRCFYKISLEPFDVQFYQDGGEYFNRWTLLLVNVNEAILKVSFK